MSILMDAVKAGLTKSSKIILLLAKIIIPVSCIMVVLRHFNALEPVAVLFAPFMSLVGLPGEAAMILVFGYFVNFYSAIGIMTTMSLSPQEITTVAVMLGISHDLFVESAISSHTGLRYPVAIALRISASLFAGILLNIFFNGWGGV